LNVKSRAEAVGALRHVSVRMMEILAGWVPTTPEMEVKTLFGRHLWLCAQFADRLGHRARELRSPLHYTRPPSPAFAEGLEALGSIRATAARIHAFHGEALPALRRACADYLDRTDALVDEPTVVIIQGAVRDIERMRADGERLLEELPVPASGDTQESEAAGRAFRAAHAIVDLPSSVEAA